MDTSLSIKKSCDFHIVNCDTDSIMICKPNQDTFTVEEQKALIKDVNTWMPEKVIMAHDGYFQTVIVVKAKNYLLFDATKPPGKQIKYKGSALKASTKEPALKQFIKDVLSVILENTDMEVIQVKSKELYVNYIKEALNIQDIRRWVKRVTISDKTMTNERANESKVRDAIAGTDYREGDRVYLYFKEDGTYGLAENFDGEYDRKRTLKKLYDTAQVFETILPVDDLFPNLTLKKNKSLLDNLV